MFGKAWSANIQLGLDFANLIMFLVTLAAVWIAWWSVKKDINHHKGLELREKENERREAEREKENERILRKISRESSARAMWVEYLKMAFDNPKYSMGRYDEKDEEETDQYDTFISIMMSLFDEVLAISEKEWMPSFEYHVKTHLKYLKKIFHKSVPEEESVRIGYSEKLISIIDRVFDDLDRAAKSGNEERAPPV
jgi:hypothetical protein